MLETILNHRSIRKFKSDPIDDKVLENILLAGTRASTTGNMQVYSIIVTTDNKLKEQLWETHFKQDMVLQAPVVMTFCADFNRFSTWCRMRKANPGYNNFLSFFTAAIDALLVAQNCALAAESYGLGICYLGTTTYNGDVISELLDLPELVVPVTTVVMGLPDESPELTDRLPLSAVIHKEKYSVYKSKDIESHYHDKEALELTENLIRENQVETLAQVFTDKRYTEKDNLLFSKKLLALIREKGFLQQPA